MLLVRPRRRLLHVATSLRRLTRVVRGVPDPERTAAFLAWLLGVEARHSSDGVSLTCDNGELVVLESTTPISLESEADGPPFTSVDPDGVPVAALGEVSGAPGPVALDHVRLNCADLPATVDYYAGLGLGLTWAGDTDGETVAAGPHARLARGSEWVHLSARDGYLSLSQADWLDYGVHSDASGPPRLIHVGFRVRDLDAVATRLARGGVPHTATTSDVARHIYVNDPDGVPALGHNVEVVEYAPGLARSGGQPPGRGPATRVVTSRAPG